MTRVIENHLLWSGKLLRGRAGILSVDGQSSSSRCNRRRSSIRRSRKIFGIFFIYSLQPLSTSRSSLLAGAAHQQPSSHPGSTRSTAPSATTCIAPHRTSQRQPMHSDDTVARRHRARRSHGRSRTQRMLAACAYPSHQHHASLHALPTPVPRTSSCTCARPTTSAAGATHRASE